MFNTNPITHHNTAPVAMEYTQDVEDDIDSLMHLLESPGTCTDIMRFAERDLLEKTVVLTNMDQSSGHHCNFRDGVVLGNHPGLLVPASLIGKPFVVTFCLHHEMSEQSKRTFLSQYEPPIFVKKGDRDTDVRMHYKILAGRHQQFVHTQDTSVHWKKRRWLLSRNFRDIAGVKRPKFVAVLSPVEDGAIVYDKSVRTPIFEVRSKEQTASVKIAAVRRTPETERANSELRAVQSDIIRMSDQLKFQTALKAEYDARIKFALAIVATSTEPGAVAISTALKQFVNNHKHNYFNHN